MADQISMFGEPQAPKKTGKPASFSLSKIVNSEQQAVFDQWLIPVFIEEWMFNKNITGEKSISLKNTVRKGGEFHFEIEKNRKKIEITGEYTELDMPAKLSFSWVKNGRTDRRSHIALDFEKDGSKTKMKMTMKLDPALTEEKEAIKNIWNQRCSALAAKFK